MPNISRCPEISVRCGLPHLRHACWCCWVNFGFHFEKIRHLFRHSVLQHTNLLLPHWLTLLFHFSSTLTYGEHLFQWCFWEVFCFGVPLIVFLFKTSDTRHWDISNDTSLGYLQWQGYVLELFIIRPFNQPG